MSDTGYSPPLTVSADGSISTELDLIGTPSVPARLLYLLSGQTAGLVELDALGGGNPDAWTDAELKLRATSRNGTGVTEIDLVARDAGPGAVFANVSGSPAGGAVVIDGNNRSSFVQNAGGSGFWSVDRELDVGAGMIPFSGATSGSARFSHVLGRVPDAVLALPMPNAGANILFNVAVLCSALDAQSITLAAETLNGVGPLTGNVYCSWLAIAGLA